MTLDSPVILGFVVSVLLFAGFVKGTAGFGVTLMTVPVLSLILSPQKAILLMALPVLILNSASVLYTWREWRELRRILPLVLPALICIPLGVKVLMWTPSDLMRAAIGAAILAFVAIRLAGWSPAHLPETGQRFFSLGMGACSGFLAGSIMMPMPAIAFYLNAAEVPKEAFIFVLNFFACFLILGQVISFAWLKLYAAGAWWESLLILVPAVVGLVLGTRFRRCLPQKIFERIVLAFLALSGLGLAGRMMVRLL